ncbi:DnaJ domain protein [Opisthorchis viverrini]|uniref:DnaJ domain protein n=1 Tax=Opisthorchis viverrini TaxID=6198 RepID=A0A1S8WT57_OPIVI|nr:DnaJ domain protein [Opisthorchis viverrini]
MVVLHRVAASPLSIIRRLASKQRTHYETLGVRQSATASEIRSAFLELSKKHHPDKQGNVEVFKAVNEAYSVLSREEFRRTYDQSLAAGEPVVHDEPIFRRAHDVYREDYYSAHQFPFGRVRTGVDKRTQPTNRIAVVLCVFAFLSYAFSLMWYSRMSKGKDGMVLFRGYRVHFVPDERIDKKD